MPYPPATDPSGSSAAGETTAPSGGILGNAIVIGFLLLLFGLGIRGLARDESRFSWGMFSRNNEYLVLAYWVMPNGQLAPYKPGDELGGKSLQVSPRTRGRSTRVTRYSPGTVCSWCEEYAQYLWEHRRPAGATAVLVELTYAIEPPIGQTHDFTTISVYCPSAPADLP